MNPFGLIALISFSAVAVALTLQYGFGQAPCDLCLLQRFAMIALGLTALIAWLHHTKTWGHKIYAGVCLSWGLIGLGFSARQVYLQSLPEELKPSCGPGLMFRMDHSPWLDAIGQAMHGSGDCAQIGWTFMGQSLAVWTGVLFLVLIVLSFIALQIKKVVR